MKKPKTYLFIWLIVLNVCGLFGQSYWAPVGAKWYYDEWEGIFPPQRGYVLIEAVKDTLFEGLNAVILNKSLYSSNGIVYDLGRNITYFSHDTVYFWDENKFQILYIFSANQGDFWEVFNNAYNPCGEDSFGIVKVDSVKAMDVNDTQLKYLYTSPNDTSIWDFGIVIENIGSTRYMFPSSKDCGVIDYLETGPLRCYCDTSVGLVNLMTIQCDTIINEYTGIKSLNDQSFKIFPNPAETFLNIEADYLAISEIQIYNLLGQLVYNQSINSQRYIIDLNMPSGLYNIIVKDQKSNIYSSLLIKL